MPPGQKIFAVFGFCDIQYFNDITGVLQTETMKFVNEVAEIVHERTHTYSGKPRSVLVLARATRFASRQT